MKKFVALLLSLVMIITLVACASSSTSKSSESAAKSSEEAASAGSVSEAAASVKASSSAAASASASSPVAENKSIKIGVSFGQNVHPFFVAMQLGIEAACKDLGITDYTILAADSSLETQVSQIENLVTMGCDVILLNPYDSDGVANAVAAALDAGVGVFTMDIDCEGSTAFVASDNYVVGQMLGDYIVKKLGGEGQVAIIDGISVTSLKDRTDGFMATIKDSNIKVVAEQQTAMSRDTALASAETILQAHPDINAFVGVNENSGMAILSAVTSANLSGIILTTVDATSENMAAIRDGKVDVGISQNPYMMGYTAVEQALKWFNGESIEEFIEVPVEYMTIDNVSQYIEREKGYGVEVG